MSLYVAHPFPDAGFTRDEDAQRELVAAARRKDKFLVRAFVGMLASFSVAVGGGLLGAVPVLFAGLAVFATCFTVAAVRLLAGPGRQPCGQCGRRMRFAWRPLRDGRGAEYLTCEYCRRYVATLRTSR
jgi:hypothetical protein